MNSIKNKHRNGCVCCTNLSASSPTFGYITHPISGKYLGLCFRHLISFCRTPKHAETDGQDYRTSGSWKLLKMGGRQRWMPIKAEDFELKSNGWTQIIQDNGQQKWSWVGADTIYENWYLVVDTHGKLPGVYKSPRDFKILRIER